MRKAATYLCVLLLPVLAGCGGGHHKPTADRPRGQMLYEQNCQGCHGANGTLGPAPPLNDPLFLAITTDDHLIGVVTKGRELMPAFGKEQGGPLTPAEITEVKNYLRRLPDPKKQKPTPYNPTLWAQMHNPGRPGNALAGQAAFRKACGQCHGEDGKGGDHGAIRDPAFLALVSNRLLHRLIITGRPDLGMPDYEKNGLTPQQVLDIHALLMSWKDPSQIQLANSDASER